MSVDIAVLGGIMAEAMGLARQLCCFVSPVGAAVMPPSKGKVKGVSVSKL